MDALCLTHIVPAENKRRFYKLLLQPDMWGGISVVREYGRIGHPGTVRSDWHASEDTANHALHRLAKKKLNGGYQYAKQTRTE